MSKDVSRDRYGFRSWTNSLVLLSVCVLVSTGAAFAGGDDFHGQPHFWPGNLVVSRSVYDNRASNVTIGTILPPGCANTTGGCAGTAQYDGLYPQVFNNNLIDGSFGITAKVYLDQITPFGWPINTLAVPSGPDRWDFRDDRGVLVTSFSSKSELALHQSTNGKYLTFMGYVSSIDQLDVSNSNTPGAIDPTNPVGEKYYRAVATVDRFGRFEFTKTNAYSGNNGRAAILNTRASVIYAAGNAGNGSGTQPVNVIAGAGAQILTPSTEPEDEQSPGTPTPVGSFSITQLGYTPDKIGKDDNFRGMMIFNNVLHYTKGSGGNGVNTVYFVDTTGTACPTGVGLPLPGAALPTEPLSYDPTTVQKTGLPSNMCILAGFPAVPNKFAAVTAFPFALWFADENTLYVADEGDGYAGGSDLYTHAAAQTTAGLQKWVFDSGKSAWQLAYTLQSGLGLGVPYDVNGYPAGNNAATNLPWAPATDGLRNLTGVRDDSGRVTIWAVTSTVSGSGDQGADPNRIVVITDRLKNTDASAAAGEQFYRFREARFGEVLRGISFTPGS